MRHAWRVVELARALLAVEPGELAKAAANEGLVQGWLEVSAVRGAVGWNEWQGATFVSGEAWDEFIDTLAGRDVLLEVEGSKAAGVVLKRRAAAAAYRVLGRAADAVDEPAQT